jgi:hypothetical protein
MILLLRAPSAPAMILLLLILATAPEPSLILDFYFFSPLQERLWALYRVVYAVTLFVSQLVY